MIILKHCSSHYTFSENHIFDSALSSSSYFHAMFICCLIYYLLIFHVLPTLLHKLKWKLCGVWGVWFVFFYNFQIYFIFLFRKFYSLRIYKLNTISTLCFSLYFLWLLKTAENLSKSYWEEFWSWLLTCFFI